MGLMKRIKAVWDVLTKKYFIVHTGKLNEKYLLMDAINLDAAELCYIGGMGLERFQMIRAILYDRSVILQSMTDVSYDDVLPVVIYDCESEEDFNELREQEIE